MNSNKINQKQIGNIFIVLGFLGLMWTFAPLVLLLAPRQSISVADASTLPAGIVIPKIDAQAPVIYDVNPWNEGEYTNALERGVAHARGSAKPGEGSTSYLFAHSSLPIWKMTHTNTPFLLLGNLNAGDSILIVRESVVYSYEVVEKKEVWPNEVEYLTKPQKEVDLILQTCTPLGTALKRLLVFAKLVNTDSI